MSDMRAVAAAAAAAEKREKKPAREMRPTKNSRLANHDTIEDALNGRIGLDWLGLYRIGVDRFGLDCCVALCAIVTSLLVGSAWPAGVRISHRAEELCRIVEVSAYLRSPELNSTSMPVAGKCCLGRRLRLASSSGLKAMAE